jgi:hypothetical protein
VPRFVIVLIAVLALTLASPLAVFAQDASPMASPAAGPCAAPTLPPGTPTPMDEMEGQPEGTPADAMAGMEESTPEAVEIAETAEAAEATPSTTAMPEGTPADQALADEAIAAAENFVNCLNSGDPESLAALVSSNLIMFFFGTTNPYDIVAEQEADPLPPITIRSLDNPLAYDDGRVSVDVVYSGGFAFGPNQVNHDRWVFVEAGEHWLLDEIRAQPFAEAATIVDVEMVDFAFDLSQDAAPAGGLIAFNIVNAGEFPHEAAVVLLPEGVTVEQVLEDPALEEQVGFFGGNFAEPGGRASFALENLEPGTYTLVCFVDEPDGVPHVVRGMVASFTVE